MTVKYFYLATPSYTDKQLVSPICSAANPTHASEKEYHLIEFSDLKGRQQELSS